MRPAPIRQQPEIARGLNLHPCNSSKLKTGIMPTCGRVWDLESGACVKTLEGHTDSVWVVFFSPDSTTIASGSHDKTIRCAGVGVGVRELQTHTFSDASAMHGLRLHLVVG
jgi:WD40 repeat protein